MTLSIWPLVRTSDQTCSCTNTPSYCTRQARATLDTVSPVESDTRWTWKFRLATVFSTPQRPREKRRIARGKTGIGGATAPPWPNQDTTRPADASRRPLRIDWKQWASNRESGGESPSNRHCRSTAAWGRLTNRAHPHVPQPLLLLLPIMNRVRGSMRDKH